MQDFRGRTGRSNRDFTKLATWDKFTSPCPWQLKRCGMRLVLEEWGDVLSLLQRDNGQEPRLLEGAHPYSVSHIYWATEYKILCEGPGIQSCRGTAGLRSLREDPVNEDYTFWPTPCLTGWSCCKQHRFLHNWIGHLIPRGIFWLYCPMEQGVNYLIKVLSQKFENVLCASKGK